MRCASGRTAMVATLCVLACAGGARAASGQSVALPALEGLAPHEVLVEGITGVSGVAFASDGRLFVTNESEDTLLEIVDTTTRVLFDGASKPTALVWEEPGRLLLLAERLRPRPRGAPRSSSGVLLRFELASGAITMLASGIDKPRDLAVGGGGVYIATEDALLRWREASGLDVVVQGFKEANGVIVRNDGIVLVAAEQYHDATGEIPGSVFAVRPEDRLVTALFAADVNHPAGLGFDALKALYLAAEPSVANARFPGAIFKIRGAAESIAFASGFEEPRGLAFSRTGDLVVTDRKAGMVVRFRAPLSPKLTAADGTVTNQNLYTITGSAQVGTAIVVLGGREPATAPVGQDGTFAVAVSLLENQHNALQVFAVGASGDGLASPPAQLGILHDNVGPLIVASVNPPRNAAGWNNTPVTVAFACTDPLSGILSCSPGVTLSTEGAGQIVVGMATDRAGNSAALSVTVNIDLSVPHVTSSLSAAPNSAGWHNAPVTVRYDCADALSGIASCSAPDTISQDGANQRVVGAATDRAGNSAAVGVTVNIDGIGPTVTATASPNPNAAGWNNTSVTVTFDCRDSLSGIAQCPPPQTVAADGDNQRVSGTAFDHAGNAATATVTLSIDTTAPTLSITSPANQATLQSRSVTVEGVVTDALSGIRGLTCNGLRASVSGSTFSCQLAVAPGPNSIVVSATDAAGNTATEQISVTVENRPPTAAAGGPYAARLGDSVHFNGTASFDPDGDLLQFNWFFGDGTAFIGFDATPSHTYQSAGSFTVTLQVLDPFGGIATATTIVTISDDDPADPDADPDGDGLTNWEETHGCLDSDRNRVCDPGTDFPPTDPNDPDTDDDGVNDGAELGCFLPPVCGGSGVGGDPHLFTFDALAYDFQGVGEFIVVKSLDDGLEIQIRTKPWEGSTVASISSAVAMNVNGDRVAIYVDRQPALHVNGTAVSEPDVVTPLPSGGRIIVSGGHYTVVWSDGSQARVDSFGSYLNVAVRLPRARIGRVAGLLGDFDGEQDNDLTTRDGTVVSLRLSFDELYLRYGESWRIRQDESLFDYLGGETTETFTDRGFPSGLFSSRTLPEPVRRAAEQICFDAGVVEPVLLEACVLDVGLTGDPGFAGFSAAQPAPAGSVSTLPARLVYVESNGRVVGEGELYSRRSGGEAGARWLVLPDEPADARPVISGARDGRYVQSMSDAAGPAQPLAGGAVEFLVNITTPGTYRLFVRWDGDSSAPLDSDSLFADVVELKDGPAGAIADWYELVDFVDGDFGAGPWDGDGGFESGSGAGGSAPMTWVIETPGIYTLRFTHREAGAAVDAFVFQRIDLPAPAGIGPPVSSIGTGGKIVVANDEWTLTDSGFAQAPDTATFVRNVAAYFTGGVPGRFLALSTNFGLRQPQLAATLEAAGHTWTISDGGDVSLADLRDYDAVFLAGTPADNGVLIEYVNSGGNVYLAGGTGFGTDEAARWATFLNAFGLGFVGGSYNSIAGVVPIASTHPVFQNVSGLYQDGGSTVVRLNPSDGQTILVEAIDGSGLYGVLRGDR